MAAANVPKNEDECTQLNYLNFNVMFIKYLRKASVYLNSLISEAYGVRT